MYIYIITFATDNTIGASCNISDRPPGGDEWLADDRCSVPCYGIVK